MPARSDSSSRWSFGGSGSIWQGRPTTRGRLDHDNDTSWGGWQDVDFAHEPREEYRPRSPSSLPAYSLPDSEATLSNTLSMGDLEPWMDHEYASQVVRLMGWDRSISADGPQNGPVTIKVPPPPLDAVPQPNNGGYCLITFPSATQAANVLASLHSLNSNNPSASPLLMPNSSRPFNLQWANPSQLSSAFLGQTQGIGPINGIPQSAVVPTNQGPQREFSIFVGDLAPETSNSDLVAVFRNPVLGLRNDREPKFIRPFHSCKSAKIMLDPVTGVSRGYGFVRFTDEADQQRALIEMHGLYCLTRPMRVSPATAKFKPHQPIATSSTLPPVLQHPITLAYQHPNPVIQNESDEEEHNGRSSNNAQPNAGTIRSVSSPVAAATSASSSAAVATASTASVSSPPPNCKRPTNTTSSPLRSSGTPVSDQLPQEQQCPQNAHIVPQITQLGSGNATPVDGGSAHSHQQPIQSTAPTGSNLGSYASASSITSQPPPYPGQTAVSGGTNLGIGDSGRAAYDEVWAHQAQARAILGNLIGPNGEQLTSTDPYNTTVFVGGLSPLISEETLRTFFAPFGDIHYVKVPLGKHCGFVQFVRKADAERAIERMQGFPIGGSRIRLSWGRSQYKAAQAAAQAAQAAQAEQVARMAAAANGQNSASVHITPDQALLLLQTFGYAPTAPAPTPGGSLPTFGNLAPSGSFTNNSGPLATAVKGVATIDNGYGLTSDTQQQQRSEYPTFSSASSSHIPFAGQEHQLPMMTPSPSQPLPHPSRSYAPGFGPTPASGSGQYSDTNSPHSTSTESSSGSSSVRFSGVGSSGYPSTSFLDYSGSTFHVNDILRHDSQTIIPRLSTSSSQSQEPSTRTTPPRHQYQRQNNDTRDDGSGELLHDLNGTLASLDLGGSYSRGPIGSELLMQDGYPHGSERRVFPTSISTPIGKITSPSQLASDSPEST